MILLSLLLLNRQEELELRWKFLLGVKSVRKVYSTNTTIGMNCHTQSFYIVATVSPTGEIRQIELNLIPSLIQPHWHGADKWFNPCGWLIIGGTETSSNVLIIKNLHLKSEVFFKLDVMMVTFLMIITRKGSLMPNVSLSFCGQVMKAVVTLVPIISNTDDCISWSVSLFICPLWTTSGSTYSAYPKFAVVCFLSSKGSIGTQTDMYS